MSRKKNEIPMWAQTGHAKPVTRREMLAAGVLPFAASFLAPNWIQLLLSSSAQAAETLCPVPADGLIPFLTLNLSGGAGLSGNFVPHDAGGEMLPSYSLMGLGKQPPLVREFGKVPFAGMNNGVLISKFLQGIRQTAPNAISNTAFVAVCVRSRDDSGENRFAVDGMLSKAGLAGSLLPNVGTVPNTAVGIRQSPAVVSPPAPLIVNSFTSLTNSLGYGAAISSALKPEQRNSLAKLISRLSETQTRKLASQNEVKNLVDCAGIKSESLIQQGFNAVDPRLDATFGTRLNTVWNLTSTTPANNQSLIFGSMVYNALKGQCGSAALEIGGYDYHNNTRTSGDAKDLEAGQMAGRILESASVMNKPVFLYITSDGSVTSANSEDQGAPWTSDRGSAGVNYILYFNPAGRPETSGYQIGHFTSGQSADENFITGNSPEAAASAVFANYLAVNKRMDMLAATAARALDLRQIDKVLKFA